MNRIVSLFGALRNYCDTSLHIKGMIAMKRIRMKWGVIFTLRRKVAVQ